MPTWLERTGGTELNLSTSKPWKNCTAWRTWRRCDWVFSMAKLSSRHGVVLLWCCMWDMWTPQSVWTNDCLLAWHWNVHVHHVWGIFSGVWKHTCLTMLLWVCSHTKFKGIWQSNQSQTLRLYGMYNLHSCLFNHPNWLANMAVPHRSRVGYDRGSHPQRLPRRSAVLAKR